jgi:hypothetical protein
MNDFQKIRDLRSAARRIVTNEELLVALFKDLPELKHFKFVKTQEYDDNNYFDDIRLVEVNGHRYGYEGYEDDDDNEKSDLPRIESVGMVDSAVDIISEDYDFSSDEIKVVREDYESLSASKLDRYDTAERRYWGSYLSGKTLPNSFFVRNNPKWAVYYAMDHGRFDKNAEFKIFAKQGRMLEALQYAEAVGRLSQEVENFFILDADEGDSGFLKTYLEKFVRSEKCA